jgi:hypothetical protein
MDDLERRQLTLEFQAQQDRDLSEWRYYDLSRRLQTLEANPVTAAGLVKLAAAIALPVGAWLLTGDLRKALAVLRMTAGG